MASRLAAAFASDLAKTKEQNNLRKMVRLKQKRFQLLTTRQVSRASQERTNQDSEERVCFPAIATN